MAKFDIGQIMPITKGEWDAETTYKICDVIRYKGTSYWVRKDGVQGIPPTGKTDSNYQMLVHDYVENLYTDTELGIVVEYTGENPRENGFVSKLLDASYGKITLFSSVEELKSAAKNRNCVILTVMFEDGGGRVLNKINPGDRIIYTAFEIMEGENKEYGAIMVTPSLTRIWNIGKDSSGIESIVLQDEFKFHGAKRAADISFEFQDDYFGDFGTGNMESGLVATVTTELPESFLLFLLPQVNENGDFVYENFFQEAEIVVKSHEFTVAEEYGKKHSYLTLTLLAHNKEVRGKRILARVITI